MGLIQYSGENLKSEGDGGGVSSTSSSIKPVRDSISCSLQLTVTVTAERVGPLFADRPRNHICFRLRILIESFCSQLKISFVLGTARANSPAPLSRVISISPSPSHPGAAHRRPRQTLPTMCTYVSALLFVDELRLLSVCTYIIRTHIRIQMRTHTYTGEGSELLVCTPF